MFIKAWYYIQDGGDGSASLRLYVDEERAQSEFEQNEGEDATSSYSDGSIQYLILDTDEFQVTTESPNEYMYDRNKGAVTEFDRWYEDQYWAKDNKQTWSNIWDDLVDEGVEDPTDIMEAIVSAARVQFKG